MRGWMGDQALVCSGHASEVLAHLHCHSLLARAWKAISTRFLDVSRRTRAAGIAARA